MTGRQSVQSACGEDKSCKRSARRLLGGRICYYIVTADQQYWNAHWNERVVASSYRSAEQGKLGYFERLFTRILPQKGKILEAGCGVGQYVLALRNRGYDVEGVEWAADVVEHIQRVKPGLPVRAGDVLHLDVPDGYYQGYISLGVVEHCEEGPEPFLAEAYRVLAPGGVACISVPHINMLRSWKARRHHYNDWSEGLDFYQYAFGDAEMEHLLCSAGFTLVERRSYGAYKGLKDELPVIGMLGKAPLLGSLIQRAIDRGTPSWLAPLFSHMRMFICRK